MKPLPGVACVVVEGGDSDTSTSVLWRDNFFSLSLSLSLSLPTIWGIFEGLALSFFHRAQGRALSLCLGRLEEGSSRRSPPTDFKSSHL